MLMVVMEMQLAEVAGWQMLAPGHTDHWSAISRPTRQWCGYVTDSVAEVWGITGQVETTQ